MSQNQNRDALAHALKLRFRTAPVEPTESQLDHIIAEVGRKDRPTEQDWRNAVHRYCPSAGQYKYGSVDNSDLNELLAQGGKGPKASARSAGS